MKVGIVYPQTEYGNDVTAIRDFAQTAEALGFDHIVAYDHVLGANPNRPGGWTGPYTHETPFQEPFVLFGFMAALTQRIRFTTGVIILPQRQTALVAKQAATLDVLSNGRLTLGVGLGWNEVEYIALGEDFHNRGRRADEQIEVMRQLWAEPLVTFNGKWHTIPDAGLNPLPVQRPIPIWFGAREEAAIRRAVRLGDGWLVLYPNAEMAAPKLEALDKYLADAGRSRADFGLEARINYGKGDPDEWTGQMEAWKAGGVPDFYFNTMGSQLATPQAHLQAVEKIAKSVGLA